MKLVQPVLNQNYVIKSGAEPKTDNLISELGIFGAFIA